MVMVTNSVYPIALQQKRDRLVQSPVLVVKFLPLGGTYAAEQVAQSSPQHGEDGARG